MSVVKPTPSEPVTLPAIPPETSPKFTRTSAYLVLWSSLDGQRRLATLHPTAAAATVADGVEFILHRELQSHQDSVVPKGSTLQEYLQGSALTLQTDLIQIRRTCLRPAYRYMCPVEGEMPDSHQDHVCALELLPIDSPKTIADRALNTLLERQLKAFNIGDIMYEATAEGQALLAGCAAQAPKKHISLTSRFGQIFMRNMQPKP